MKSPEEIYSLCPDLRDIAIRLEDSVKEAIESNKNKKHDKEIYPEHSRIAQIWINGRWQDTALKPKSGRQAFEETLAAIVNTRNPSALKIEIYNGKRITSNRDEYTCYLAEDATVISEIANKGLKGPGSESLELIKTEIETLKKGNPSSFELQLLTLKHAQELQNLKYEHQRALDEKQRIIEDLEIENQDLEEQVAEQDGELGSAADKLLEKVAPKPFHVILGAIAEQALEDFIIHRPKVLKDAFKLSDEQIKTIFTRDQKQIASASAPASENNTNFEEVKSDEDEYKGYDPKHADGIKNIHIFVKALTPENYALIHNIFAFCCTAEGEINMDHTNLLLAHLMPIAQKEAEAQ